MIICPNCKTQFPGETIQLSKEATVANCPKCKRDFLVNYPKPGMLTGDDEYMRRLRFSGGAKREQRDV